MIRRVICPIEFNPFIHRLLFRAKTIYLIFYGSMSFVNNYCFYDTVKVPSHGPATAAATVPLSIGFHYNK